MSSSRTFRCLTGNLLLAPDPDQMSWRGIWFSDNMHRKSETGICVQHTPKFLDDLTGHRLLVEKWAWKVIRLDGVEFYVIDERTVYAVLDNVLETQEAIPPPVSGKEATHGNS